MRNTSPKYSLDQFTLELQAFIRDAQERAIHADEASVQCYINELKPLVMKLLQAPDHQQSEVRTRTALREK
ncbi:hypothetical protein DUZ99_05790 [Xylanibacillus composti]|uniref:hypothetical protein n=1 Tax=Xylanibacillus composti TaxID=1572762 RepID=UPI001BCCF411|nr:hypothetical protein [Xylanibacillus composti]MDT9724501.1 hypothetical protein [Xylanibacillus composti]